MEQNILTKVVIQAKKERTIYIYEEGHGGDPQSIMQCWYKNHPRNTIPVEFIFTYTTFKNSIDISKHFN